MVLVLLAVACTSPIASGQVHAGANLCNTNAECDDLNPCNGQETCVGHSCISGTPLCDDADPCNGTGGCNPATGECNPPGPPLLCADDDPCTFDTCKPGVGCVYIGVCDDGNPCNGHESCDPDTGACSPAPAPLDCDDGNPCTDDTCNPDFGCWSVPNIRACNDGNPCTRGDRCTLGTCQGTPISCDDHDACNGVEVCRGGVCVAGAPLDCDDRNPCTDDACDPGAGCRHADNSAPCDDGNLCTFSDVCVAGTCAGVAVLCDDGNACNGQEVCDRALGACIAGTPPDCDDGNTTTADACDAIVGCVHTPAAPAPVGSCSDLLVTMRELLHDTPARALGGRRAAHRLRNLTKRAIKLVHRLETPGDCTRCARGVQRKACLAIGSVRNGLLVVRSPVALPALLRETDDACCTSLRDGVGVTPTTDRLLRLTGTDPTR